MKYDVWISWEATEDIWRMVKYIAKEFCNPQAAKRLQDNLKKEINSLSFFPFKHADTEFEYRGFIIYKKVYQSYLIFYFIDSENERVFVIRILKDLTNWKQILLRAKRYHFSVPGSGEIQKQLIV